MVFNTLPQCAPNIDGGGGFVGCVRYHVLRQAIVASPVSVRVVNFVYITKLLQEHFGVSNLGRMTAPWLLGKEGVVAPPNRRLGQVDPGRQVRVTKFWVQNPPPGCQFHST